MANLKNLSERIKSVTSIQQVTKAMKMVAAAKVKKAQDKMEISRPYSKNTQELICRILPQISSTDISLVEKRDVKTISIETGIQNGGLGLLLIFGFFEGLGGMSLLAAFWGIWDVFSGMVLGSYWGRLKQ